MERASISSSVGSSEETLSVSDTTYAETRAGDELSDDEDDDGVIIPFMSFLSEKLASNADFRIRPSAETIDLPDWPGVTRAGGVPAAATGVPSWSCDSTRGFQNRFRLLTNQFVSCLSSMPVSAIICAFS